jgi:hypothetical protein
VKEFWVSVPLQRAIDLGWDPRFWDPEQPDLELVAVPTDVIAKMWQV